MTPSADLTFVHLSDIHFRKGRVGTKHDPDEQLRDALEFDLRRLVQDFGAISGIIITGDVAWGGQKSEYAFAESWIRSVSGHLQCSLSDVMVIPGNHDVDRAALKKNDGKIAKLQRKIRHGGNPDIAAERLAATLSGKDGQLLLAPLKAYNSFAKQFGCDITAQRPYWERPFKLGDGSTLLVRGATSTWLSGPSDSERLAKLLYGSAQYGFTKTDGTFYLLAAHHPPPNMIDVDEAIKAFDFHCKLQLFGHKHNLWITKLDGCARIVAGALHPDRREKPWTPRYNILQISGELTEKAHIFSIRVYPRRWSEEFREFMADFTPEAKKVRVMEYFIGQRPQRKDL